VVVVLGELLVKVTLLTAIGPMPVLLKVNACTVLVVPTCWAPNATGPPVSVDVGAVPVPVRLAEDVVVNVPDAAATLSDAVSPFNALVAVGWRLTTMAQVPPTAAGATLPASDIPAVQPFETTLYLPLGLVKVTPLTAIGPLPVLLNVNVCCGLVVPTCTLPNAAVPVSEEPGATPWPVKASAELVVALPEVPVAVRAEVRPPAALAALGAKTTPNVQLEPGAGEGASAVPAVHELLTSW